MSSLCLVVLAAVAVPVEEPDLRCGSYCLYVSLRALDLPVKSYESLEGKLGQPSSAGYSLGQLDEVARSYGAHTLGVQTSFDNLVRRSGRFACIAHLKGGHFVNIGEVHDREAYMVDPPNAHVVPLDTLRARWDGAALLISNEPLLREEDLPWRFPWQRLLLGAGLLAAVVPIWWLSRRLRSRMS